MKKKKKLKEIPARSRNDDHFPERVILHCSATPDHPIVHKDFDRWGAADIDKWHKERGFNKIGYHFVIRRTGEIEFGRDIGEQGAHTYQHNYRSIGICVIGTRFFTNEQLISLGQLAIEFRHDYGIPASEWFGHCEYDPENKPNCPGIDMEYVRKRLSNVI